MIYREFFGLHCEPFDNTNNSKFFYPSEAHKEALASLLFGIKTAKGILLLTGEIGAGKTQVAQVLKEMLLKDTNNLVCELTNPKLSEIELLQVIARHIGLPESVEQSQSSNDIFSAIHNELVSKKDSNPDFRMALLFDEAQLLSQSVLEKIRLLTNLESNFQKLVQVVLIGQPELTSRLNQHENRPLMQRVAMHRNISYFDEQNTEQYIRFRLAKAGRSQTVFSHGATRKIHIASMGSPRLINLLCDNALFIGFTKEAQTIDESIIDLAIQDVPAGLLNQAIKPIPTINKNQANPAPIATKPESTPEPQEKIEAHQDADTEDSSEFEEPDLVPVPETAPDLPQNHWYQQFWVKALAFLIAVFVVLYIYDKITAMFKDSAKEPQNHQQMQQSYQSTQTQNQPAADTTPERYKIKTNQQQNYDLPAESKSQTTAVRPTRIGSGSLMYQNENTNNQSEIPELEGLDTPVGTEENFQMEEPAILDFPFSKQTIIKDSYRISSGDIVSRVIENHYGSYNSSYIDIVRSANPNLDFKRLRVNQSLVLPRVSKFDLLTTTQTNQVYIYFASRKQIAKAEEWAQKLKQKGYPIKLEYMNGSTLKFSRIYIGPFATSRDAQNAIDGLDFVDFNNL